MCCEGEGELRGEVRGLGYGVQEKSMSIQVAEKISTSIARNMVMWMEYHVGTQVGFYYQPIYLIFYFISFFLVLKYVS